MMGGLLHKNMKKKRLYNIRKLIMEKRRMKEEEEMQDLISIDDIDEDIIDENNDIEIESEIEIENDEEDSDNIEGLTDIDIEDKEEDTNL